MSRVAIEKTIEFGCTSRGRDAGTGENLPVRYVMTVEFMIRFFVGPQGGAFEGDTGEETTRAGV